MKKPAERPRHSVTKRDFCAFCHLLYNRHLVTGVGGNISARVKRRTFVTPSGYSLRDMTPEVVVTLDGAGRVREGGKPTKDVGMHLGILNCRPDIDVVCHVHGSSLIALSAITEPGPDVLPPVTPGFVYLAHPLPMLPFMVPGTAELSEATTQLFLDPRCSAVLLQNHGLVTVGRNFEEALNAAEEIDEAARVYLITKGKATVIPAEGVAEIKKIR